jgi:hypothetical protein
MTNSGILSLYFTMVALLVISTIFSLMSGLVEQARRVLQFCSRGAEILPK